MNQLLKKRLLLILIPATVVGFLSCKKQKPEEPEPTNPSGTPTGTFMFHLHTYIDNNEVDAYNITYTTDAGRNISLSMAQFYISEIQLVKLDGTTYDISGKRVFKVFETETYVAGDVPVGNYKSIRFKVGLDAATNALNPGASSDSVMLNHPEMWFGSTPQPEGYVFMHVAGKIDTTADMTGTPVPFVYKIGTNANYKQVIMPDQNFSILEGQVEFGHIIVNYNKLFSGLQLNQSLNLSVTTTAENAIAPATVIVNNIPSLFIYE